MSAVSPGPLWYFWVQLTLSLSKFECSFTYSLSETKNAVPPSPPLYKLVNKLLIYRKNSDYEHWIVNVRVACIMNVTYFDHFCKIWKVSNFIIFENCNNQFKIERTSSKLMTINRMQPVQIGTNQRQKFYLDSWKSLFLKFWSKTVFSVKITEINKRLFLKIEFVLPVSFFLRGNDFLETF